MSTAGVFYFDDTDALDMNCEVLSGVTGMLGSSVREVDVQEVAGRAGGIVSAFRLKRGSRPVVVPVQAIAGSNATFRDTLRTIDVRLQRGIVRLRSGQDPNVEFLGLYQRDEAALRYAELYQPIGRLNLNFLCPNPFGRHVSGPFAVAFRNKPVPIPCGTAPCSGTLYIDGATNPVITYANAAGDPIATLGLTVTHVVREDVTIIDLDTQKVVFSDNGVTSNGFAQITSGGFFSVSVLDDGDYGGSAWPMLSVSSGAGLFVYDKNYL